MEVVTITKDNFEEEVLKSKRPVLLDFWAVWCGPCKMISPVIEEIAAENDQIKVGKVNVDEEAELTRQYRVMSIPTLLVFKNGELAKQAIGVTPKADILKMIGM